MFARLEAKAPEVSHNELFEKKRKAKADYLAQDLVVDRREGWKDYMKRQVYFRPAPLVPREELPAAL